MDDAVPIVLTLAATTVVFLVCYLRERARSARLRGKLWGLAAAQGLMVSDSEEVTPAPRVGIGHHEGRRLDQVEAQLDQITQQIDRLAESQDFLSRLLVEQADQRPDPRLRTPH